MDRRIYSPRHLPRGSPFAARDHRFMSTSPEIGPPLRIAIFNDSDVVLTTLRVWFETHGHTARTASVRDLHQPHDDVRQTIDAIKLMYDGAGEATEGMALTAVQAQATLALAYEQRTANLIALWSNPETSLMDLSSGRQRVAGIGMKNADEFLLQILERLGVTK